MHLEFSFELQAATLYVTLHSYQSNKLNRVLEAVRQRQSAITINIEDKHCRARQISFHLGSGKKNPKCSTFKDRNLNTSKELAV